MRRSADPVAVDTSAECVAVFDRLFTMASHNRDMYTDVIAESCTERMAQDEKRSKLSIRSGFSM